MPSNSSGRSKLDRPIYSAGSGGLKLHGRTGEDDQEYEFNKRIEAGERQRRLAPETDITARLRAAPLGTLAPSHNGGCWQKKGDGRWQWNGHTRCPGSTFPRPGGDWTGELYSPTGRGPL